MSLIKCLVDQGGDFEGKRRLVRTLGSIPKTMVVLRVRVINDLSAWTAPGSRICM